jgi:hypothetical protein
LDDIGDNGALQFREMQRKREARLLASTETSELKRARFVSLATAYQKAADTEGTQGEGRRDHQRGEAKRESEGRQ